MRAGQRIAGPHPPARTPARRYAAAVGSVAACLLLTRLLDPITGPGDVPLLLFLAPVMVSAWYGGLGPGLLAAGLAAGVIGYGFAAGPAALRIPAPGQMAALALFIAEGSLVAYLTARARQATDSLRLYRAAQEAHRLRDEFLDMVSHDLRAPLSTIVGWTRVLRKAATDHEVTARAFDSIERSAGLQTRLIDDLLDLSRVLSGRFALEVRAVELGPVITAAVERVQAAATAKAIRLDVALDPGAGTISGDPARLEQIVSTLVSHAVKVTPPSGSVRLHLRGDGLAAEITLSDTGPGPVPRRVPDLFELLHQGDSPWARQRGDPGLGLAMARHLTELHGGTIRAESPEPGWGARYRLSFPLAAAGSDPRRLASAGLAESRASADGRRPPDTHGPPTSSRA
ncbi:MAG TPA: HAMP domain-containing sensor histidine kinase [Methylomirabilota bacterium]|jgi:signal transduction histidine kinase